ncbi:MAG: hypothetical protein J6V09_02915 [Clostridia bacterium]|nr:hypothetical protein [Clostridia bacterium]
MSNFEKYKITEDEARAVMIANSADRPNAFNAYRAGGKSAADVKAMFDAPFNLTKTKLNGFVAAAEANRLATDERIEDLDRKISNYRYVPTEEEKREIADVVIREFVSGDEVKY